jgi:hypothetical protein
MTPFTLLAIEWTDKAQAIGSLVAIPGALAAFWVLFQRDREKTEAVRQLAQQTKHLGDQTAQMTTQAAESVKQTGHLADQVAQLGQQAFHLERIHEAIAKALSHMAKDDALNKELKKIELRPDFEFKGYLPLPGRMEAELRFLNRGGTAKLQGFRGLEGVEVTAQFPDTVRKDDSGAVVMKSQTMLPPQPIFELNFSDELGNSFSQRFDMRYGMPKAGEVRAIDGTTNMQEV